MASSAGSRLHSFHPRNSQTSVGVRIPDRESKTQNPEPYPETLIPWVGPGAQESAFLTTTSPTPALWFWCWRCMAHPSQWLSAALNERSQQTILCCCLPYASEAGLAGERGICIPAELLRREEMVLRGSSLSGSTNVSSAELEAQGKGPSRQRLLQGQPPPQTNSPLEWALPTSRNRRTPQIASCPESCIHSHQMRPSPANTVIWGRKQEFPGERRRGKRRKDKNS